MSSEIWLSIITPVLNGGDFIAGCIENVESQNASGIEHIIMDGVSTDDTLSIARRFAAKNPSIRIVSENDGGQSAAMNHGIRLARAPVIGFLNADDFYEPGLLNRVAAIFRHLPDPSFVTGNCNVLNSRGEVYIVNRPSDLTLLSLIKSKEFPWNPSSYFYHKSLHDIVGGYDEEEHHGMDLDFILRAVQKANVIYYNEIWGNYRIIEGTKTHEANEAGVTDIRADVIRAKYERCLSWSDRLHLERGRAQERMDEWMLPFQKPFQKRVDHIRWIAGRLRDRIRAPIRPVYHWMRRALSRLKEYL